LLLYNAVNPLGDLALLTLFGDGACYADYYQHKERKELGQVSNKI
jgi:hypothetical protein